jgi:N,N'-diacetyllegionaminate synthase
MSTLIIAEAGVNHNGQLALARRLVEAAASAGADVVKFQTFSAERLATAQAPKAQYQKATGDGVETQRQMLKRLELTRAMHEDLLAHCARCGIAFLSSGFDTASVDLLVELGLKRFKIPSGEITNLPYLRHVGALRGMVILSTGMATLDEIAAALTVLRQAGTPREHVTVLHCTSAYPTPLPDVNLRAMQSIRAAFDVSVGYSDHTPGIEIAVAAVALGATVIEKHLTLDRGMQGPDHRASLEPHDFAAMVTAIRNLERALGDGCKRPSASEAPNLPVVRKSLVAARAIAKGQPFTADNVTVKRPGTGLSPMRWDEVLGRRARRDFAADELLEL